MKTLKELKEERGQKIESLQSMVDTATTEKRELNDSEKESRDSLNNEIDVLDKEITAAEKTEKRLLENVGDVINKENEKREKAEVKNYSMLRAMNSLLPNTKLDGLEREMHEEAKKEARDAGVGIIGVGVPSFISRSEQRGFSVTEDSATKGGELVGTQVGSIIDALVDDTILKELGVNFITGLTDNLKLPRDGSVSATWEGETDENAATDNTLTSITLSPHRLGAKSLISTQLLAQAGNASVENLVWGKLKNAVDRKLQDTFITSAAAGDIPGGVLNESGIGDVAGGTNGLAPTRDHLLKLEKEILQDNARGNLKYLINTQIRYKLKGTALDSGSGRFLMEGNNNELEGYPVIVSNAVPSDLTKGTSEDVCSAIILGAWEKAMIGQWAGLDMTLDPYTKADYGQIRLIINSFWDIAFERPEYFAAMLDALTA